jgi:hypothetical protein
MSYTPPYQQPYLPPGYPMLPPKGQREYSIFGAMIRAPFFNGKLYRDVARNWSGINFWYLFLLELITWGLLLIKFQIAFTAYVHNDFPKRVANFPSITLSNGQFSSPVPQPYIITDSRSGKPVFVLDTTGKINSLDDTEAVLLITDHKAFIRQQSGMIRTIDLSKSKRNFTVDKSTLIGWAEKARQWAAVVALPLALILSMICRLLLALIYGLINLMLASMLNVKLPFDAAMRLAVVAFTPVILLNTILDLLGIDIQLWILIAFLIDIVYLTMAVRANAVSTPPPQGFPVTMPGYTPQQPGA